jgi:hypothetical protein
MITHAKRLIYTTIFHKTRITYKRDINWENKFNKKSVNDCWMLFKNTYNDLVDTFIPSKNFSVKPDEASILFQLICLKLKSPNNKQLLVSTLLIEVQIRSTIMFSLTSGLSAIQFGVWGRGVVYMM